MKFRSHCKINLFLHIIAKKNDGYHQLESLFYFPDVYDEIEIIEGGKSGSIEIDGPFADSIRGDDKNNLILKTYSLLKILFGAKIPDLSFKLTKNLPVAAGIGGGSANAADVLKALNEKYALGLTPSKLYRIGARLGADVPPLILGRPCFVEGIGEIVTEVEIPKLHVVLVNPGVPVVTAEIFKMGFENYTKSIRGDISFKTTQHLIDFLETTKNDLEVNAKKLCPQIDDVLTALNAQHGCLLARMSGSGATCFGIFESKDAALLAVEKIKTAKNDWWVAAG